MKYFLDTEFIEGFHKPIFGKRRHFIDLISIGIICEDGSEYYAVSNEFKKKDADEWVRTNVIHPIEIKMYQQLSPEEKMRNYVGKGEQAFSYLLNRFGKSNKQIAIEVLHFFGCWRDVNFYRAPDGIEVVGYYSDYDWVLFCSLFGRMIDLPKGFPMYCIDLKQNFDEIAKICMRKNTPDENVKLQEAYREAGGIFSTIKKVSIEESVNILKSESGYPKQDNEHNALDDAKWNKKLHEFLQSI